MTQYSLANSTLSPKRYLCSPKTGVGILGVIVALTLRVDSTNAIIINVPADHTTIQAAINAAAVSGDEIVVGSGTYNEAINFSGKAINLRSSGGAAVTIMTALALPRPS